MCVCVYVHVREGGELDMENEESMAAYLQGELTLRDFVWPEDQRQACMFEEQGTRSIPEVDLGSHQQQELTTQVVLAAKQVGCFRVINHGVPLGLLHRLHVLSSRFFKLPLPSKQRARRFAGELTGYNCGNPSHMANKWWNEGLQVEFDPSCRVVLPLANKVGLPDSEAAALREALVEYYQYIGRLAKFLFESLMAGLGVDSSSLHMFEDDTLSYLRFNHYPPCPQPDLTLGLSAHTDPNPLTILHEDIGGLQVLWDGKWVSVKPKEGSLIVIIGDILQIWSNDGYESVMHRAALNSRESRLSIGFFYYPRADTLISPLKETVDENRPARYKEATCIEIKMNTFNRYARSKSSNETPLTSLGDYRILSLDDENFSPPS